VPVLILSARTLSEDRTRGFDSGADQYLTKPFDLDELLSRINNLLSRGSRPRPVIRTPLTEYSFGNVQVNFDRFEVSVGGNPVRLTHLEMKLLEYFIRNEGRVIPRHELLENVWELPGHMNTRAPDQFIRRLRKALEENASRPRHLLTIRDAGYRFVANP
jgi:two-component system OmpR family response regulator